MGSRAATVADIVAVVGFGLALRAAVSLHSYSGAGMPPMHGDYEAQRHWQEVTINLPPVQWYRNSSDNDLQYWGLDYPPLTAYHSWTLGRVAEKIDENFVALEKSRGFESDAHKSFMRLTVLLADCFVYVPGMLTLGFALAKTFRTKTALLLPPFVAVVMIYPGQMLIDNGHFQYNNVSLGMAAFAIAAILRDRHGWAAFFFTLALNYKQMELYHALPFFVSLLRVCFAQKSFLQGIGKLLTIGGIVLSTFLVLWLPWIRSLDDIAIVVNRLFPIGRGVFEDKVASFWCALSVVYKLKSQFSNQQMALICLSTTAAAVLPINVRLFVDNKKDKFLYSLANTAMAFFLFSFQVHEKSILLVALPALCLFDFAPLEIFWLLEVTTFSMFPLLIKDGLVLAYFALFAIFHICLKVAYIKQFSLNNSTLLHKLSTCSSVAMIAISVGAVLVPAPLRYPFLWSLVIALFSCAHFGLFFIFGILRQL